MNQILVTEKLYVTPELKKKKKMYKINFILSLIIIVLIVSIYFYIDYKRNKSAQVSEQILADINQTQEEVEKTKKKAQSEVLTVVLNNAQEDLKVESLESTDNYETLRDKKQTTEDGYSYYTIAKIEIPKLNLNYPIIEGETGSEKETEELLKLSPCKLAGPNPNEKGNFCIVGHNYRNQKFFSKVPTLKIGEQILITDLTKDTEEKVEYKIYRKYTVVPEDLSCLEQKNNEKKEITLITCTDDSKQRVIVKAREVK